MLSCFYGDPIVSQRSESWRLLKSFKPDNMGWCIIGDFNEILFNDEKKGGTIRGENQMNLFRQVVEDGQLFDLGWRGAKFTWSNRHEDSSFTKERLDRALANKEWKNIFTVSSVETMTALCSDHSPIFLDCKSGYGSGYQRSYNQFKYDASWSKGEGCTDLISNEWLKRADCGSRMKNVQWKLEACSKGLKLWCKNLLRNRNRAINEKTKELSWLQRDENAANMSLIKTIQSELGFLLDQEDTR